MENYLIWAQDNILSIVAVTFTLVLIYHYLIERDSSVKLSKRYRNSIYEAQSKVFLNATQYLISGNKDLAIKEFLSAVDINRETIETYFALGGLFRSNGEIEKAISIHRSLIARENISEENRLRALKELALDFDKGGFIDKAVETYKDVLKLNPDQDEVIRALCRIYEDIEDWDKAYEYRQLLSKATQENQSETISHILVQKAKKYFEMGDYKQCYEELEDAFKFAPSVSAKILKIKLYLIKEQLEDAKYELLDLIKDNPMYTSFIFESLNEVNGIKDKEIKEKYLSRLDSLKSFFLELDDSELEGAPSVTLSRVRMLKIAGNTKQAYKYLREWMESGGQASDAIKGEYIGLLIELGKKDEVLDETKELLKSLHHSLTKHFCQSCGYNSDEIFWRCPQCYEWETIQFRWKI